MIDSAGLVVTILMGAAAFASIALSTRSRAASRELPRRTLWTGAAISLAFILMATLLPATSIEGSRVRLDPTEGLDELQAVGNVVLFFPLGAFLALLGFSRARAVVVGGTLSTLLEIVQFFVVTGRYASTGDVILNMIGSAVGHVVATAALVHRDDPRGHL